MLILSVSRIGNPEPYLVIPHPNYRSVRQYWLNTRRSWDGSAYVVAVSRIAEPAIDYPLQPEPSRVVALGPVVNHINKDEQPVALVLPNHNQ